jgi:hypothetical protein
VGVRPGDGRAGAGDGDVGGSPADGGATLAP